MHHIQCLIFLLLLLSSCQRITNVLQEVTEEPFGTYQDSLDAERMAHYLHDIIAADTASWRSDLVVRHRYDSISDFDDIPLWFSEDGLTEDADDLLRYLQDELPRHGFSPSAFYLPEIEQDLAAVRSLAFDSLSLDINEVLPRLDYNLTKAYVKYVTGIRYGFVQPAKLLNRLYQKADLPPGVTAYAHLYDYVTAVPDYDGTLGKISSDERMDYLYASVPANKTMYETLQGELETATDCDRRNKIAANMERCRWRINHPSAGERRVMVNIPSQLLWAVGADTMLTMKVAVGAWDTKTPLLCSDISYIQVNPEWSLPPKIAASDFPRHAGDSAWFVRHNYFAVSRTTGDTINITHLGAEDFKKASIRFVQRGGRGNALGRIVFRFSNSFSVYLHDTNSPGVFSRDRRTVSHGCVRVENPYQLALFLLPDMTEWTRDCLRISMDMPPETERGMKWVSKHQEEPRPFRLLSYHKVSPRVPVYILYYTMFPDPSTGIVESLPDVYGYDKPIISKLHSLLD